MDNNYDDNRSIQVNDYNGGNQYGGYGGNQQGGFGLSVASMVLGIVSILFCCCFWYISLPCGLVGLILGAIAIKKNNKGKGMAIAGLVLSIVSLALVVVTIVLGGAIWSGIWSSLGISNMF